MCCFLSGCGFFGARNFNFPFPQQLKKTSLRSAALSWGGKKNTDRTDNTLKETAPSPTRHTYILCGLKARLWPHY